MKKILCLILLLSICLCSCSDQQEQERFADMKADFSKFNALKDVALVVGNDMIYFHDYEVDLEELIKDDSQIYRVRGTVIGNDNMYLLVSKKANGEWSFSICQCDLNGNNLQILHEQKNLDCEIISAAVTEKLIYVKYKSQKTTFVDCFNYYTKEYLSLDNGKDLQIEDYLERTPRPYSVKRTKDQFVISDNTGEIAIIDEAFLKNTEYYDLMQKYEFLPFRYSLAYNKITLVYRVKAVSFLPTGYPMLVFEYDVNSGDLVYLAVMNPFDCAGMDVLYNIKS